MQQSHAGQGSVDARHVDAATLKNALINASIPRTWTVAEAICAMPDAERGLVQVLRATKPRDGFRNQLVGRIAEFDFETRCLAPLAANGFTWQPHYAKGDNRDYSVVKPPATEELSINVKTASTLFREAQSVVKLDPHDCVPISVYKALGGSKSWPDLIYADLIDFDLRAKADGLLTTIGGDEELLWDLFSWYAGKGAKAAEDAYIKWLHQKHQSRLQGLIDPESQFYAISARRAIAIQHALPRRCPGLGIKGGFGEVNVHVSVAQEMTPWGDVQAVLFARGIPAVQAMVLNEVTRKVPEPLL